MKKVTAILLCLLIVLSMAACGETPAPSTEPSTEVPTQPTTLPEQTDPTEITEPAPTEPENSKFDPELCAEVFGHWAIEVKLDNKLMVMPDFQFSTSFFVGWDLREDGTYTARPDDTYETNVRAYEEQVVEYMVNSRKAIFTSEKKLEGKKEADIEAAWVLVAPEIRESAVATVEKLDFCGSYAGLDREGHYYVEDGSIYLSRPDGGYDSFTYLLGPTTLTFNQSNNVSYYEDAGFQFPLTLYIQTPGETTGPTEATEAE